MSNFRSIESASLIYDLTMSMWLEYKKNLKMDFITSKYEDLIVDFDKHILKRRGILIIEHSDQIDFKQHSWFSQSKRYGSIVFSFFEE